MTKTRLEAFSDGVIAIILTILVLELKTPHSTDWKEILNVYPYFISYIISFLFIAIYWVNHHHLIHTLKKVNSKILWTNILLLFSLSLIPWTTGFLAENHFEKNSVIVYTVVCLLPALAFSALSKAIISYDITNEEITRILHSMKKKEYFSQALYTLAILFSFIYPVVSLLCIFIVSCSWVIPNKEIEKIFD
jgi:uncharacterized membrane protein